MPYITRRQAEQLIERAIENHEKGFKGRLSQWLRDTYVRTIFRLAEFIGVATGIGALIFAVVSIQAANEQSRISAEALRNQSISNAWQIFGQEGASQSARQYALESLLRDFDRNIQNLQFGCESLPALPVRLQKLGRELPPNGCDHGAQFHDVDFRPSHLGNSDQLGIWRSDFGGAVIRGGIIEDIDFFQDDFRYAIISPDTMRHVALEQSDFRAGQLTATNASDVALIGVDLSGGTISGNFLDLTLDRVSLEGGSLSGELVFRYFPMANFTDTDLSGARISLAETAFDGTDHQYREGLLLNISGAIFCDTGADTCAEGIDQSFFDRAWYYEERPPKGLEMLPGDLKLRQPCAPYVYDDVEYGAYEFVAEPAPEDPCRTEPFRAIAQTPAS